MTEETSQPLPPTDETPESQPPVDEGVEPEPLRPPDGDPLPPRITSISPIGGGVAGGLTVTLTGSRFRPGAEVYFGGTPSPSVTYVSAGSVNAVTPPAAQTGTVPVTLINLDGGESTLTSGFTYVSSEASLHAEVLGVSPLTVLEDTETEVTVRGRNLISAYTDGLVALRGPTRVSLSTLNVSTRRDDATGIEELIFTVHIVGTPPLGPMERVAIQVLASLRPAAASDGIFESSRQMFVVLPRAVPVTIAFTDLLETERPNLVVVAGRNLEGCWLDYGAGVTVHAQKSDDRNITGIVTVDDAQSSAALSGSSAAAAVMLATQLTVRDASGVAVAQFDVSVVTPENLPPPSLTEGGDAVTPGAPADAISASPAVVAEDNELSLALTPAPDQQMLAPTEEDSALHVLGGGTSSLFFDWSNLVFDIFDLDLNFVIINEVRLIPFFDGGGDTFQSPVLAQVGKLFRVRGAGLLLTLRVEIIIQVRVLIIIGFRFNLWPFGYFNEFSEFYPYGFGSVVISFRIIVTLRFRLSALIAIVEPGGTLRVAFRLRLSLDIDFFISPDRTSIRFDPDLDTSFRVNHAGIFPFGDNLFPCGGRFQLASENGVTAFADARGGSQSFYFPRQAGPCCLPWVFNLQLLRFAPGASPEIVQDGFRTEYCLNALGNPDLLDVLIVSNRTPNGYPPPLSLEVEESDIVRALGRPVDEAGNPIPGAPRRDLTTMGFKVEFFLATTPASEVVDSGLLKEGDVSAILPGENVIRAAASKLSRVIDEETGEELPSAFWPGAVTGFDILSFINRGLMPAVRAGNLPVIVASRAPTITVEPALAYWVEPTTPGGTRTLREAPKAFDFQGRPVQDMERSEPFEQSPRQYVLAAKIISVQNVTSAQTFALTVSGAVMQTLNTGLTSLSSTPPLSGAGYSTTVTPPNSPTTVVINRDNVNSLSEFFSGSLIGAAPQSTFTGQVNAASKSGDLVEIANLNVWPNAGEVEALPAVSPPNVIKFVPPSPAVAGRHVVLSFNVGAAQGNVRVTLQNPLVRAAVTNGETYEEYLRVLVDAQRLLTGDPVKSSYATFPVDLLRDMNTSPGPTAGLLNQHGASLWTHASGAVQGTLTQGTLQDDRQLYLTRLLCIGAVRAYAKRNPGTDADALVASYERPSRGFNQTSGEIPVDAAASVRRAVVTGFDPFGSVDSRTTGNPSGLIALWFDGKTVSAGQPAVRIRTAIFPVRYKEFDARWVEDAVPDVNFNRIVMLMTCSMNGDIDRYDIERWAGKNRVKSLDNNLKSATGASITIPGNPPTISQVVVDPIGNVTKAVQFLESTLPYLKVITSDIATRRLRGPADGGPADTTPFVTDQSYSTIIRSSPPVLGEVRDSPPDETVVAAYEKQTDVPDNAKLADSGSGGNYLSNEIFYRTALRRENKRPTLPSGHFHLPTFVSPSVLPEMPQRQRLIEGAGGAIERFLRHTFRLVADDLNFPATSVNLTSAPRQLVITNGADEPIRISAIETTTQFGIQVPIPLPTPLSPLTIGANSSLTFSLLFAPTAVGANTGTLTLREPGGEVLLMVALSGQGTPVFTISGQVTENGNPLQGVQVTLTGVAANPVQTGADGRYSFPNLPSGGNYTVTPSKQNYTFSPSSQTFSALGANQTGDFTATPVRRRIRGRVRTAGGTGIPGATVTLSGSQTASTTSDSTGVYTFDNLPPGGSYTVTPAHPAYAFSPASQVFNNLTTDVDFDFPGALVNYTIAGRVTVGGAALAGVTVTLSGSQSATATSDANGNYSFTVVAQGNYTVTPTKADYTFSPASAAFNNIGGSQTANFAATFNRYRISGSITNIQSGAFPGATVTLSGSQSATTTTDSQGLYAFGNLPAGGNYTVTPTLSGYEFMPVSRAFNALSSDQHASFAAFATTPGSATIYDAVSDFSPTQNQGAAWSYGYRAPGGAFALLSSNDNIFGLAAGM
ncbi:MAG: hypothetical protein QOH49_3368, partial [Acidobacteriota bacterium]|nr:hypothetical protein [Acidobacteriota bacterium]